MSDYALPDPKRSARPRTAARPALCATLAILLALPTLWMARSAPIDPTTAEILRRLREPPPPPEGENALAALMMLRYELPAEEALKAIVGVHVQRSWHWVRLSRCLDGECASHAG